MRKSNMTFMIAGIAFSGAVANGAQIVHVDDDAAPGGDGLTWATAYRFLQDGLADAANEDCELRIAQGIYRADRTEATPDGTGDRDATFEIPTGVALIGGYAGLGAPDPDARDVDLYETVLSGDLLGDDVPDFGMRSDNTHHVLTSTAPNDATRLDGLTISGGFADDVPEGGVLRGGGLLVVDLAPAASMGIQITACTLADNSARSGGSICIHDSGAVITGSSFVRSRAAGSEFSRGGGLLAAGTSIVHIHGSTFVNHSAEYAGGAVEVLPSDAPASRIESCTFISNQCGSRSTLLAAGAALAVWNDVDVIACDFIDNTCTAGQTVDGGAVYVDFSDQALFVQCRFIGNQAIAPNAYGGAVYKTNTGTTFVNCELVGNTAGSGGAIFQYFDDPFVELTHCTVVGNTSEIGPAVANAGRIAGCVVHGNTNLKGNGLDAQIIAQVVDYSIIQGWDGSIPGEGTSDADPLFIDPDNGDYRIMPGSPAIDAGDNTAIPLEFVSTDLSGGARFIDDPATIDLGLSEGFNPVADIGAHEFASDDCNTNGMPDADDIANGTSSDCDDNGVPDECEMDCNGNGIPDACDILDGTSLDCVAGDCIGNDQGCNPDGILDECHPDCNSDGIPDACEEELSNDECLAGILLFDGTIEFSMVSATASGPAESCGEFDADAWIRLPVQGPGTVMISTCGSDFIGEIAVYSECPFADNQAVACTADGCNEPLIVDLDAGLWFVRIGAHDFGCNAVVTISQTICAADLDGDSIVGTLDLLELLGAWGPCPECPADLDGDRTVGTLDLLQLLGAWGVCD